MCIGISFQSNEQYCDSRVMFFQDSKISPKEGRLPDANKG